MDGDFCTVYLDESIVESRLSIQPRCLGEVVSDEAESLYDDSPVCLRRLQRPNRRAIECKLRSNSHLSHFAYYFSNFREILKIY